MNVVDCNPVNTEHHWLCMLQTLPYRLNALKKLNWYYRLWTLLALNAIGLSRRYRMTLNTVYTESYWHINSTELTLHWTLHKEQTALNATHNLIHTTKHLKSHHGIPHHTAISRHTLFFTTPFCTTSHSVVHPGHRHSTSYNMPFHIT